MSAYSDVLRKEYHSSQELFLHNSLIVLWLHLEFLACHPVLNLWSRLDPILPQSAGSDMRGSGANPDVCNLGAGLGELG